VRGVRCWVKGVGCRAQQGASDPFSSWARSKLSTLYKTVKARFRANMGHARQSSQIQDSQARSKRVKPDPERIWHVSDSRGQILAWAYQGHQGASDPY